MVVVLGQTSSILSTIRELKDFLAKESIVFENEELALEEMVAHVKLIFERVISFYRTEVKPAGKVFQKGSEDREKLVTLCKACVEHVGNRQRIHKKTTSDPYLQILQIRNLGST